MKKYISRATKSLAILTLISAVIFAVGIILIIADFSDIALQIGLTSFGSLMSIIFITCFLTGLGIYDVIGAWGGAGSVIPITGFSNSISCFERFSRSTSLASEASVHLLQHLALPVQ